MRTAIGLMRSSIYRRRKSDDTSSVKLLRLKHELTCDHSRNYYYSGSDINLVDLEKKNLTGSVLISGRNLLDLDTKGACEYKKALASNEYKWDSVQIKPKHSEDTVQDCIEYVRREI